MSDAISQLNALLAAAAAQQQQQQQQQQQPRQSQQQSLPQPPNLFQNQFNHPQQPLQQQQPPPPHLLNFPPPNLPPPSVTTEQALQSILFAQSLQQKQFQTQPQQQQQQSTLNSITTEQQLLQQHLKSNLMASIDPAIIVPNLPNLPHHDEQQHLRPDFYRSIDPSILNQQQQQQNQQKQLLNLFNLNNLEQKTPSTSENFNQNQSNDLLNDLQKMSINESAKVSNSNNNNNNNSGNSNNNNNNNTSMFDTSTLSMNDSEIYVADQTYMPGTASLIEDVDKQLMVVLRDGRTLIGYLRSIDQYANLLLSSTFERIYVGNKYGDIPRGIFLVRGENVVLIGEVDFSLPLKVELVKVDVNEILELQKIEQKKLENEKNKKKVLLERCSLGQVDAALDEYY